MHTCTYAYGEKAENTFANRYEQCYIATHAYACISFAYSGWVNNDVAVTWP